MGDFRRRLRNRYPSWFRYTARNSTDTPTLELLARLHPTDGTRDAPMDAEANRLFRRIAIGIAVVGAILIVLAVLGK